MLIEYVCPDCKTNELHFEIFPKKKCPTCNVLMDVNEELEDEAK